MRKGCGKEEVIRKKLGKNVMLVTGRLFIVSLCAHSCENLVCDLG